MTTTDTATSETPLTLGDSFRKWETTVTRYWAACDTAKRAKEAEDDRRKEMWAAERVVGEAIDRVLNSRKELDPEARLVVEKFLVIDGHLYKWSNNKGSYLSGSYSLTRELNVERLDIPPCGF